MSGNPLVRTKIIAEFTSNHLGDERVMTAMLQEARRVGVDVVKFQSWQAAQLRKDFPDYEATYARHKSAELSDEQHHKLVKQCRELGLEFLTTCFDVNRVDFLASLGLSTIKVASPDATSWTLIDRLAAKFPTLIISTGLITPAELDELLKHVDPKQVVLLHCISLYPTPLEQVNLARMEYIRERGFRAGFSDHTEGAEAAMLAITRGAEYIEKHFTLSKALPGKDQQMSATPDVFQKICQWRDLVQTMMGQPVRELTETERKIRELYVGKWGSNQ
ncbi:MAG: N-acetylneuraminate synthase family protein [Verrucomicrobiota bacterium]